MLRRQFKKNMIVSSVVDWRDIRAKNLGKKRFYEKVYPRAFGEAYNFDSGWKNLKPVSFKIDRKSFTRNFKK